MGGGPGDRHDRPAVTGQQRLGGGLAVPVQPVRRGPDDAGALGGVLARGQVADGGPDQHLHLVTGVGGGDAGGAGERPGPRVGAGPDGVRADREPAAGPGRHQLGRVAGGWVAAGDRPDGGELPARPGVSRDVELGPGQVSAGLAAGRDHGIAGAGHLGQRLVHARSGAAARAGAELAGLGRGVGARAQPPGVVPGVAPTGRRDDEHDHRRRQRPAASPGRPAGPAGSQGGGRVEVRGAIRACARAAWSGRSDWAGRSGRGVRDGGGRRGVGPFGVGSLPDRLGPLPDRASGPGVPRGARVREAGAAWVPPAGQRFAARAGLGQRWRQQQRQQVCGLVEVCRAHHRPRRLPAGGGGGRGQPAGCNPDCYLPGRRPLMTSVTRP